MSLTFYMLPSFYYTVMFCSSRQTVTYSVDTKGCWSPSHTNRSGVFSDAFRDPKCSFEPAIKWFRFVLLVLKVHMLFQVSD